MTLQNKLRNSLVSRIHQLSTDKLNEVSKLLNKLGSKLHSKEATRNMAGTWRDLDDELLHDLTNKLHDHRANDRQIN